MSETSIHIFWTSNADNFSVFTIDQNGDEEKVWSGENKKYTHTNLQTNTIYRYKLTAFKNGSEQTSVYIDTKTLRSENEIKDMRESNKNALEDRDNSKMYSNMFSSNVSVIYNADRVKLIWQGIPTDGEYDIYRNGEYLDSVAKTEFYDDQIEKNEIYHYSIKGYKALPNEAAHSKLQEVMNEGIDISNEQIEQILFYEPKSAGAVIRLSEKSVLYNEDQDTVSGLNHPSQFGYGWLLRYSTFIPMEYAPNPWCIAMCTYEYFGGDNRSFSSWSSSFRTRIDAYVTWDWTGNPEGVTFEPQTGISYGYDGNFNLIGSGQADADDDHKIWMEDMGSDWIYHRASVSSSNPLTFGPAIDAFYYAKVWEDGTGEFYGVHDQAPSHEFYIISYPAGASIIIPIHYKAHQGFEYLWPHSAKEEWQINLY